MPGQRKSQVGTVVSTKMQKTVVVTVEKHKRHRLYHKRLRLTRRYKAHDEHNECRLGDIVRIEETRPLSREKRWRVAEVLQRGDVAEIAPRDIGVPVIEPTATPPAAVEEAAPAEPAAAAPEAAEAAEVQPEPEAPQADASAAPADEEPAAAAEVGQEAEAATAGEEEAEA